MPGILDTIKKTLGIATEDTSFDVDLILFINSTLFILSQLGLKEAYTMSIIDKTTLWTALIGARKDLEIVKTYILFKTKLMFDPPTNSAALEALKRAIDEQEWRIANLETNKGVI